MAEPTTRHNERLYWAVLLIVAVGTSMYITSFANKVTKEMDEALSISRLSSSAQMMGNEATQKAVPGLSENTNKIMHATLTTNLGAFTVEFYPDAAPNTVANFIKLAKSGFYDGTRFHRVIKGFMIQGGDPLSKDTANQARWGTGDPGYKFDDEIDSKAEPYLTGYKRGVLAMANSGPNTNGSQFFVMHADTGLPPNYTIFGKVTSGMDTVDKIATVATTGYPSDRPLTDVVLEKVVVQ